MKVIIYNKTLNPKFWTSGKEINPEIRVALLRIAKSFLEDVKLKMHIRDIILLGSSANYNWTPESDCDLHILVDFNDLPTDYASAREYTKHIAKQWNVNHDISIKGHNVEVYIQDITEENRSTGVYSLLYGRWTKEPVPQEIKLDKNLIQKKYTTFANRIMSSIKSNQFEVLKKVMDDILKMREVGLSSAGEFSTENIVFKILRQRGLIKKVKDKISELKSKNLSIKETLTSVIGNCKDEDLVDAIFGSVSEFARQIELNGDEFQYKNVIVTYDPESDVHTFSLKANQVQDGYDPTSFGPNPAATIGLPINSSSGGHDPKFYQNLINLMKNR